MNYDDFIEKLLAKYHFSRKSVNLICFIGLSLGIGAAFLCLILSQFPSAETVALIIAFFSMLSFLISGIFCELFSRCPYCHKRIPSSSSVTCCMYCGRKLDEPEDP